MGYMLMARLHAAALAAWERRHEQGGQGTVEYVGVVVMVTLLVAAVAVAAKGWAPDIGGGLKRAISESIKKITGSFG